MYKKPHHVLNLGVGTQSTALYFMSHFGHWPIKFDYAIFADPGAEKQKTYDYLEWLKTWSLKNNSIPIIDVGKRTIYEDGLRGENSTKQRFVSIPAFTNNPDGSKGMLRRQCTTEYKIVQIEKQIRKLQGLMSRQRNILTYQYFGITVDELARVSHPQIKKHKKVYPFVGLWTNYNDVFKLPSNVIMTKHGCIKWMERMGLPIPPSSACFFCPYQSDAMWHSMKTESPEEFDKAVIYDKGIRNLTKAGVKNPVYLHESRKPLDEVDFTKGQNLTLFDQNEPEGKEGAAFFKTHGNCTDACMT